MTSDRPPMSASTSGRSLPQVLQPAAHSAGDATAALRNPDVLEVALLWNDTVLGLHHVAVGDGPLLFEAEPTAPASGPLSWVQRVFGPKPLSHLMPTVSSQPGEEPLAQITRTGFTASLRAGWTALVEDSLGSRAVEVGALGAIVDGGPGACLRIDTGSVQMLIRMVPAGLRSSGRSGRIDLPLLASGTLVSAVGMVFALVIGSTPPPLESTVLELPDRYAGMLLAQIEPPVAPVVNERAATNQAAGRKAKRAEGTAGEKQSRMKVARGDRTRMERQRLDREVAENAGILGAAMDSAELAGLFSSTMNTDLTGGVGGLIGARGVQMGSGGLGTRGDSLGGGGDVEGIGGLSTRGRNTGDGTYGKTGGRLPDKEERVPRITGDPILIGGLDRGLVDAVVKQHLSSIRYCYQRQLTRDPELAGKLSVGFVIAADGSVSRSTIKSTSIHDSAVESCVANRFLMMKFPEPKGGGVVMVSYPFMFSPG